MSHVEISRDPRSPVPPKNFSYRHTLWLKFIENSKNKWGSDNLVISYKFEPIVWVTKCVVNISLKNDKPFDKGNPCYLVCDKLSV